MDVVAALIKCDDKVLIARRKTGSEFSYGKWEFPGGKVETHETEHEAIEREIKEEFEVTIKANKFIANVLMEYPSKIINLKLYDCTYLSGEFKLHDHFEYKFVDMNSLLDYDLCTPDKLLVLKLTK